MKMSFSDKCIEAVLLTIAILVGVGTLYPFLNVLAIAFNDSLDTVRGGIGIFPRVPTLENFRQVFAFPTLLTGLVNSVIRTVAGTLITVFCTAMMAYVLSRTDFMYRKLFNIMFVVTMYVSGGMVTGFLLIRNLGLFNNFLVYILPGITGAWFIFITRSYIETLPLSLQESAKIDGANDFTIFTRIILPLSVPVLATIALFAAVGQWNSWFDTYLFTTDIRLTTLQFELQKILLDTQQAAAAAQQGNLLMAQELATNVTPQSIQMAITIVVIVPIILVYPFLQRYFISGMTLGAVKG